jgi:hypothetical protein
MCNILTVAEILAPDFGFGAVYFEYRNVVAEKKTKKSPKEPFLYVLQKEYNNFDRTFSRMYMGFAQVQN